METAMRAVLRPEHRRIEAEQSDHLAARFNAAAWAARSSASCASLAMPSRRALIRVLAPPTKRTSAASGGWLRRSATTVADRGEHRSAVDLERRRGLVRHRAVLCVIGRSAGPVASGTGGPLEKAHLPLGVQMNPWAKPQPVQGEPMAYRLLRFIRPDVAVREEAA